VDILRDLIESDQGTCLGGPFEHIGFVLKELSSPRLAACFDTCHAFAFGHDVSTPEGLESTLKNFDETIGFDNLAVVHLNDSKNKLGKHLDRHEQIGQGQIGREAVQRIVTHPLLKGKPFILETPELETMIETNLETVRELSK
jgi:apurinic endonuclease APN1